MKKFNRVNILFGWLMFIIAAYTYLSTIEPTASLWDCGEYIASSYKLQVSHPPGAPLFMILGRFFSLFARDSAHVAKMINSLSALASAFTILFLFWTITHLAKKFAGKNENEYSITDIIAIIGSGVVGSLAYTFSDTFWFSAVEGEVYASSSFFTALVFWIILKWENEADERYANRWIILIAYLMGLSIGVHLLNLLAIPAIVLVYYFRKYTVTPKGLIKALILALIFLGSVMYVIIPGIIWLATRFELVFVNGFGLPYNSGVLVYGILLFTGLIAGIYYSHKNRKVLLNTIILSVTVIIIGYSTYAMIVIRSLANPPMDENNPENVFVLLPYINREQYGDRPLFHGQYFNARPESTKEGKATYTQINGKYKITNHKISLQYNNRFTTFFPRMYSSSEEHIQEYMNWGGIKESDVYYPKKDEKGNVVRDSQGNIVYDRSEPKKPPTFLQNLRFFFAYQVGHMYLRYFFWNFSGRQNDEQGFGGAAKGNWITGIDFLDRGRVGSIQNAPPEIVDIPSRNTFFLLPFLLGLMGLIYQLGKDKKNFWVVFLLFVLTGLAIVVYLNQTPNQPRERDYAYAGSFYAFAIWIGLGVYGIIDSLGSKLKKPITALFISLGCLLLVPGIMARENWDDHDRSGRYTTRDIAYDYLNTCAPNAILFTNGDNDTFPLWYAQEVEGIRPDVRIVNLMLLNMDWYIDQMKVKTYDSNPLPITLDSEKYLMGKRDVVYIQDILKQYVDLTQIVDFVASDDPQTKLEWQGSRTYDYIPTRKFRMPVDTALVMANGTVQEKDALRIIPDIEWDFRRSTLGKSEFIVMDILANNHWKRPVYYVATGHEGTLGLEEYMQLEGFAYRLVPIKTPFSNSLMIGRINTDIMYENLMNKFRWGRMNQPDVYLDNFHLRTLDVIRLRNRFTRLADALILEGKQQKAAEVLDRCMEVAPPDKVPYEYFIIGLADAYYRCNLPEKADTILIGYSESCDRLLGYYLSQNKNVIEGSISQIRFQFQLLQNMMITAQSNQQLDLVRDINEKLQRNYQDFTIKAERKDL